MIGVVCTQEGQEDKSLRLVAVHRLCGADVPPSFPAANSPTYANPSLRVCGFVRGFARRDGSRTGPRDRAADSGRTGIFGMVRLIRKFAGGM